jgi:ribosomal protein S18 acetylase RimI-like enzyme
VTRPMAAAAPRRTAGAVRAELEELLQPVRQALAARDEDPTGAWVEESAAELASGAKAGWFVPGPGGGIVFFARRGSAAFGHLHAAGGRAVALGLASTLLTQLPEDVASLDLGFTGLAPEEERSVVQELARRAGSTVIERRALERPLTAADGHLPAEPPGGLVRVPLSAVTLDALADLDRRAFQGSTDALLLGQETSAYRRALEAMLESRLGRFLPEASAALLQEAPTRLVGAVLTAERSPHRALVLDLVVDPERRRQGLGRYLLGWTLRAVWALGYDRARLWATVRNAPAMELYRAFGFRTTLEATIYRWDRGAGSEQPQTSR